MSEEEKKPGVFDGVLPKVMQTIRASSALAAQDVNFYKSLDAEVSKLIDDNGGQLLDIVNSMLQKTSKEAKSIEYGKDHVSSDISWKPISNALDNVFEKIDILFDNVEKNGKTLQKEDKMIYLEEGANDNVNQTNSGKKLSKPQLSFKNKIDNSEANPFKPKLSKKPNALKSLEEVSEIVPADTILNEETGETLIDPAHYVQPYEYEIDNQPYPESILQKKEPTPSKDWNETSAIWIETKEGLEEMIQDLRELNEIAVDLEHHDYRTYYGLVCLMQISNREKDWIIDTLKLRDDLEPLNEIFTNPQIIKVFHGAFMDIIWLQRDLGLYIVSLFDTFHASKKLGFPKFSLAYLLETFANFKTSKKYQLSDWRVRPLLNAMKAYARSDTHFLLNIFDQLRNKLIDQSEKDHDNKLQQVLYESRQVAKRRFEYTKFRPLQDSLVTAPIMSSNRREPYNLIMYQYNVPREKKPIMATLYEWRDIKARELDESPRFIMSNQVMVSLAQLTKPVDASKVLGSSSYLSEIVRVNANELSKIMQQTMEKMEELEQEWEIPRDGNDEDGDLININKLAFTTVAFKKLIESFDQPIQKDLIKNNSQILSRVFKNGEDEFLIEYDGDGNVIHHHGEEFIERYNYAMEQFDKMNQVEFEQDNEDSEEKPDSKQEEAAEEEAAEEAEAEAEEEIDSNEVITLKKKKMQKKQPVKSKEEQPAYDYENADKVLLDMNDRRRQNRQENKKKRSFDPYNKEQGGPQSSKRSKRMNTGKTTTFTNKKR
ncbi:hypothetical protein HYPBUDRAFT_4710 [Hyphopichia burtonii NRRL Y-1933]|uniref:HRDC domain-containing protein n=1 Tax=Hyphopichia burtonii NRRL Y-1933 TaxID=984485 RepID=A0A1E4RMX5_9ASCO|nr:hypothetical protein HYPBUDRAFT_4710 [Hyphopichia burtonii NRRL Y-1933]ODV68620.1 hypothetical protein HYPBUDRAFT_4710 [Hyphopichia burtonii NRRL Y-1933]